MAKALVAVVNPKLVLDAVVAGQTNVIKSMHEDGQLRPVLVNTALKTAIVYDKLSIVKYLIECVDDPFEYYCYCLDRSDSVDAFLLEKRNELLDSLIRDYDAQIIYGPAGSVACPSSLPKHLRWERCERVLQLMRARREELQLA